MNGSVTGSVLAAMLALAAGTDAHWKLDARKAELAEAARAAECLRWPAAIVKKISIDYSQTERTYWIDGSLAQSVLVAKVGCSDVAMVELGAGGITKARWGSALVIDDSLPKGMARTYLLLRVKSESRDPVFVGITNIRQLI